MAMPESKKKNAKLIIAAIVAVLTVIVVFQNLEQAPTRILLFTLTMPRALLLLVTLAVGFILGLLFASRAGKPKAEKKQ